MKEDNTSPVSPQGACPKCRTLEPHNCHSMYCPMRPSNELAKTESGWRIGGTNESESVTSPGYSTAIFDENETFIARSFGYTYDESIERAKLICCKQAELIAEKREENERLKAENRRLDEIIDEQRRKFARR